MLRTLALPALWQRLAVAARPRASQGIQRVELNQGAAQCNHIGVSVDLRGLEKVSETLASLAEVRYLGISTGRYDIILEAFFGSSEHLLSFVSERLGGLDGVTRVETSIILRVDKFSYEWELPLEH
jgi:DNA-binding Lrp family transcriptional regulator